MKVFFDTSVLIAAIVEPHPMHTHALPWLGRAKGEEFQFLVASHTLAELYAVLTTLPVKPKIQPGIAWRLIHENVGRFAKIITLSQSDYRDTIRCVADLGLSGGIIYDALIAKAAEKSEADRLLTFKADDFKRIWPKGETIIDIP